MKTAYLYVRVSTDEQKRKGYSLPEQEDRLLKYCESNNIQVKGIYREDFSAKNFNRPEWKQLVWTIKKDRSKGENNILFIKWDRFSRNIEYAYEMIGMLRKYNTTAMAIDQPIDFSVPESAVMLAIYLSVPEAENTRRALNTASGMRRARQMGRCPNKAPIGYVNLMATNGKKFIAQKQPEARIIAWAFHQIKKNIYRITDVWKMVTDKGLSCSLSNFSKLLRNPIYCGQIPIRLDSGEHEMFDGIHEPLISISIFNEVQDIINTKRKVSSRAEDLRRAFFLRGFLECPTCNKMFTGSFSRGSKNSYPYYHCRGKCRARISATKANHNYEQKLKELMLSDKAVGLFYRILDDSNLYRNRAQYLDEQKRLLSQLAQQRLSLSKARKLFVEDILKIDDYGEFKKEYLASSACLKKELGDNMAKLMNIDEQRQLDYGAIMDIFKNIAKMDIADKRNLVKLFPPKCVDLQSADVSIQLPQALSKIIVHKTTV